MSEPLVDDDLPVVLRRRQELFVRACHLATALVALALGACGSTLTPLEPVAAPTATATETGDGASPAPGEDPSAAPTSDPSPPEQEPTAEPDDGRVVLSPCTPVTQATTRTIVEATGPRPSDATIDAALEAHPDMRAHVRSLESEGVSTADARHEAYAQIVAQEFFAEVQQLPGYVSGAVASPIRGRPFSLELSGDLPDDFDPSGHELGSYGLEVTTGVAGYDEDLFRAAQRATHQAGLVVKDIVNDHVGGTIEVQVVEATPDQVAAFETALDEPTRVCLVQVRPDLPCDAEVVAAAEAEADRQGEVITGGTESPEAAEEVRRSHLGLDLAASEEKAQQEGRPWRVVAEDGVQHAITSDLQPGRLNVTACRDVVVEALVEGVEN